MKPMTKAEWEAQKAAHKGDTYLTLIHEATIEPYGSAQDRIIATLDALFAYRERTRGMISIPFEVIVKDDGVDMKWDTDANKIAKELGLE